MTPENGSTSLSPRGRRKTEREKQEAFALNLMTVLGASALVLALATLAGVSLALALFVQGLLIAGLGIALGIRADSLAEDLDVSRRIAERASDDADDLAMLLGSEIEKRAERGEAYRDGKALSQMMPWVEDRIRKVRARRRAQLAGNRKAGQP